MFHLATIYDQSNAKSTHSIANAPDQRPGARRLMEAVRNNILFNKGHITPKIETKALREFEKRINIFEPGRLCENIREDLGYTKESLALGLHHENELQKFRMVESAMQIALDTYNGAMRENGNPSVTHPLMTGALGAATGEPTRTVILDLFHDCAEDTLDMKYPEIKFRVQFGGHLVEYDLDRKIYAYVKENFGRYGKGLARDMRVMTRYIKESEGKSWQRIYKEYLFRINHYIDPVLAKGNDSYVNLLDLPLIKDRSARSNKGQRLILKATWNAQSQKRLSWIKACLIQNGISKAPGGKPYAGILNDVSRHDIDKFEKGWTYNPVRQFDTRLFRSVNLSGSPAIDIYPSSSRLPDQYEIELPFLQNEDMAHGLIRYAFGKSVGDISRARSILPTRLTSAMIFTFRAKVGDMEGCMARSLKIYDDLLASGILLPQLSGFDRKEWADAARARMERVLKERQGCS